MDAIVLSPQFIKKLCGLDEVERKAIFSAFTSDVIFKTKREIELTPYQELLYLMLFDKIKRDSNKFSSGKQ